ncbi:hypothetical protein [Micromonospora okii]|uniref:hypothetical protein n=1 Tax=Micromonospora okii TaxID=1182970 RepID=UPI001E4685A2|nr:hypothetical protein [Micromonospora okii]
MVAVRDVVRAVVTEAAPRELPLVDGLATYDDETVVRLLRRTGSRREPLGFGWGEAVGLLTPVVWLVLDQVAQRLAGKAVDTTTSRARGLLRRFARGRRAPADIPSLTADELAALRAEVLDLFTRRGLDARAAAELTDTVVRRLGPPADEGPGGPNPAR